MTDIRESPTVNRINFVQVGAVAAFLVAVTTVAIFVVNGVLSEAASATETEEFLNDAADKQTLILAAVALFGPLSLLIVPYALGLYYGLRHLGEDYMRVALLAGIMTAVLHALIFIPGVAVAAYVVPAWAEASDEPTRAILLSNAQALLWSFDATLVLFDVALAVWTLAASIVMLRIGSRWWLVVGWVGIVSFIPNVLSTLTLTAEVFFIADLIGAVLFVVWALGAGVGLSRLKAEELS